MTSAQREMRTACMVVAAIITAGAAALYYIHDAGMGRPTPGTANIFYVLASRWEPWNLAFILTSLAVISFATFRHRAETDTHTELCAGDPGLTGKWVWVIAGAVAFVGFLGAHVIYHNYPMSMDEFGSRFQARLFLAGADRAVIPDPWSEYAPTILPTFVGLVGDPPAWYSGYLPLYAAMMTPFSALGIESLLNPLLGACSIVLIAAIAARLLPGHRGATLMAAGLLAISPQFLATSMSAYTMPAHLALNLLWLYLFIAPNRAGPWLALPVGIAAMGLHQFVPHGLFAAPFFLLMLVQRRFILLLAYCMTYLLGIWGWSQWFGGVDSIEYLATTIIRTPRTHELPRHALCLMLLFVWQSPLTAILSIMALRHVRALSDTFQALAAGLLLTLIFYAYIRFDQGHGWGYRYAYPVIGNLTLLAVAGWYRFAPMLSERRRCAFVTAGIVVTLGVLIPYRLVTVEKTVRVHANMAREIANTPHDVVVISNPFSIWYGRDLVRTDPLFEIGPIVVDGSQSLNATDESLDDLLGRLDTSVTVRTIDDEELMQLYKRAGGE